MIRKLRLKFVAICMTLVTAVLAVVFLSVYFTMERSIETLSRQVLYRVAQDSLYSGGSRDFVRPEISIDVGGDRVLLPYFTVEVWGSQAYVTGGTYDELENTEALQAILSDCLSQPKQEGTIRSYRLRYLRQDNGLYQKIAFVDMSMEMTVLRNMMGPYLVILLISLLLLLGVSVLLSRWATRPVEKAWKQQRQFLSDASHELKTPLTVILSNAELLEAAPLEDRPAHWADNIHTEARRMRSLVEEMLTLARADNMVRTAVLTEVSLSDISADAVLAFEPVAFEAGKPLEYHIDQDAAVLGDGDKLRQLVGILLDNAIKYGAEGGTIRLRLQKTDRQAILTVANPGEPIPPEKLGRLFERFYRTDDSRGEQSGFGLGLSIAQTIAQEHKASLKAESDAESTRFIYTMALKK
ncbi:sensor histidine kinase [Dysosmobacter sp.]|uniref:sensor histidine kinase n=1 Tax=Dysosmobacter sp. TaxID=2591382 RepID=UPI002A991AAE|nr:HAMP domain-containing sensor histidine kinase [Dysosmobacter sp.]MDY5612967.1 HAMP domain-containing sensor histidine kinase [Dysosmobacter sp.]